MRVIEENLSSFGMVLRTFRKRRRLTQQQLAEVIGVHRSTLINWEQGDFLPASKTLVLELARHLRLDDQETRQLLEASLTALTPYFLVPLPRNPYFTGRKEILEELHAQLGVDRAVALTQSSALHGLGGIGKTQIALEYAYQHALEYSAVFWVRAETNELIISSFWQIAEMLQLPECQGKEQEVLVTAVKRWLSTHSQWLFIWDNLDDLALLDQFLPSARSGALLLTTRLQALGTFAQGLSLWPMEQEEALLFFLRRAKILEPGATREHLQQFATCMPEAYAPALEVVTLLGGLPLALDQAGAYLEETQCGLPMYLTLLHTRHELLLQQRGERVRDHPESVSTTVRLSMTATTGRHPAARELLQVCALLQPDAIPEELFLQGARYLGETLAAACRDVLDWNQVVASACAYSLLHRQPKEQTFSMHRLVQAVLKGMLPETVQHTWKRRVLHAMSQLFPFDEKEQADYWQRCERLLPHALQCLTWSEEESPRIALMTHVATYFLARSRFAEAEALYLQARHLGEQTLGVAHPQVGEVLYGLALLYSNQRKYTEAEALYLQAMRLGEQTLGANHPQVGEVLCRLAMLYGNLGKYAEAEPLYQRALSIREHALGADHPQVATVLQGLAVLYDDLGKYAEAEPLYQRALSIREQTLGADHPQVATVLNNLAVNYQGQGRYAEAEPLLQRVLHIWESALGLEHPRVMYPLHSLAEIRREQGRYAEAELLLRRALHISELAFGSEDHLVAIVLHSLALLSQKQDRDAEAETLFQRALSIQELHFDPQHPETAQTLHDLAMFRQQQGKLGEALSLAERALSIRSRSLGDTHPQTIATCTLHVQLVEAQTDAEEDRCSQEQDGNLFRKAEGGRSAPLLSMQAAPTFSTMEEDSFEAFLAACCELHPRAWCRSADLWQAYEHWGEDHQERYSLSRGAFIAQLKAHGCRADRINTARIWRGIDLVNEEP